MTTTQIAIICGVATLFVIAIASLITVLIIKSTNAKVLKIITICAGTTISIGFFTAFVIFCIILLLNLALIMMVSMTITIYLTHLFVHQLNKKM